MSIYKFLDKNIRPIPYKVRLVTQPTQIVAAVKVGGQILHKGEKYLVAFVPNQLGYCLVNMKTGKQCNNVIVPRNLEDTIPIEDFGLQYTSTEVLEGATTIQITPSAKAVLIFEPGQIYVCRSLQSVRIVVKNTLGELRVIQDHELCNLHPSEMNWVVWERVS